MVFVLPFVDYLDMRRFWFGRTAKLPWGNEPQYECAFLFSPVCHLEHRSEVYGRLHVRLVLAAIAYRVTQRLYLLRGL